MSQFHNLEIRISTQLTLEQVEELKDYLFDCITRASIFEPDTIKAEEVDLIVLDADHQNW